MLAASGHRAIVELKGQWDADAATLLAADIAARGLDERIIVASFDARTLAAVEAADSRLPLLIVLKRLPADAVAAARRFGARGILIDRRAVTARPGVVDELHAAGLRVVVHTLNSDEQWDAATAAGVDGIVTDDPATLSMWQQQVLAGDPAPRRR
ncbi:glycerophosphodiester phosphodiesterase [Microbacterium pullorum]|uniref:glycerophosphodiester phosphodiesterase n=1 Tax=Microbacterium pullorum TaxID=2762236 RepID=UPI00296AB907|nr:glycerophosphodiester phosphodiesterase [Microbacterium pullorum]